MLSKQTVLGVELTNASEKEIIEEIFSRLTTSHKTFISTPNPEMIVYAAKHPEFKANLNKADVALCDGIGLFLAAKLLGKPVKQRITGTDCMKLFCEESAKRGYRVGLLGGKHGVAVKTREVLLRQYPGLEISFAAEEWSKPSATIDILFVAFGHPKQEQWIVNNLKQIPARAAMGVGGAFDYISGNVPRAPGLVQSLGFEWLYRLIRQPWRWRRQMALFTFMRMVIRERIKH